MVNHTSTGNHYLDVIGYFEFWPSMALAIVALCCFGVAGIIVSVVRQETSDFWLCALLGCDTLMLWCSSSGCIVDEPAA